MRRNLHLLFTASIILVSITGIKAQDGSLKGTIELSEGVQTAFIPEIQLVGNNEEIPDGDSLPSAKKNAHFGNVGLTRSETKEFFIRNAGPAGLVISDINFTGENPTEFSLAEKPAYPINIDPNMDFSIHVVFTPKRGGTRSANINIINNDIDEATYNVKLEGEATFTTIIECPVFLSALSVYPNPAKDIATVELASDELQAVTFRMFNLQGQEVIPVSFSILSHGNQRVELNTADLDNGIYYLSLASNKGEQQLKIAVMH